jgi:hypothetical protein
MRRLSVKIEAQMSESFTAEWLTSTSGEGRMEPLVKTLEAEFTSVFSLALTPF